MGDRVEHSVDRSVQTKAALAMKRARGERVGTVPYGYRVAADGRSLEADPNEQAIIAAACSFRRFGFTLRAVCDELARRGMRNRKGKPFTLTAIHNITTRPKTKRARRRAVAQPSPRQP
jgi:hypothetical protein